ncbi:hypothetical protein GHK86_10525 [Acidimicrobiaceae bacterium USS-CC1]|uniref:Uncharacterized protein n=1 Tax=Acidiferrimicrobium australe TaxID=2664430 RepID=A0ABW9QTH5_9ACTN|nr:hypothetical protein [Acidiferrimicrobium australe]
MPADQLVTRHHPACAVHDFHDVSRGLSDHVYKLEPYANRCSSSSTRISFYRYEVAQRRKEVTYMSKKEQAVIALALGLVAAAVAQTVVSKEAALLGLSAFEIALVGALASSLVRRLA